MAERSKALVSGTSLFGGEGSNPSSVTLLFVFVFVRRPVTVTSHVGTRSRLVCPA